VAGQCLRRGLVDEILVYVMPVLLGDGIGFSPQIDLEPVRSSRSQTSPSSGPRPQEVPALV
jgi:dihydrofolate reductase